ncbi:MAG: hypothetical protein WBY71_00270, partial [Nitrososphaeraceae archaeon]
PNCRLKLLISSFDTVFKNGLVSVQVQSVQVQSVQFTIFNEFQKYLKQYKFYHDAKNGDIYLK